MKKILGQKGFTLVEMLVAMSIFVIFVGVLLGSYTGIVKSQRDANDYRVMYAEARHVFESVIAEFRDGMVDYGYYPWDPEQGFHVISKDGKRSRIVVKEGVLKVVKGGREVDLNSEVSVTDFNIDVYPYVDPYDLDNVYFDGYQFHPLVSISAVFEKEKSGGEPYEVEFQTSVSSRIYNQVIPANEI